jgi:hypothetical protein
MIEVNLDDMVVVIYLSKRKMSAKETLFSNSRSLSFEAIFFQVVLGERCYSAGGCFVAYYYVYDISFLGVRRLDVAHANSEV